MKIAAARDLPGAVLVRIRLGPWGELAYSVDVAVARDGSKAVVVARNNPTVGDGEKVKRYLYCASS